jgi:hypothetical protein
MFYAYNSQITDVVFIESDQFWKSSDLIKLLNHDLDFVGGTYRKKTNEKEEYVLKIIENNTKIDENGLMEVAGLGTGFLRLSKKAINMLFESTVKEYIGDDNEKRKMIFDLSIADNGELIGEDIYMCNLYRQLGGKIYFDTNITVGHVGLTSFNGNFKNWFSNNFDNKEL